MLGKVALPLACLAAVQQCSGQHSFPQVPAIPACVECRLHTGDKNKGAAVEAVKDRSEPLSLSARFDGLKPQSAEQSITPPATFAVSFVSTTCLCAHALFFTNVTC